jgi:hypothetical protein
MGKFKELQILESDMFDAIEGLHLAMRNKNLADYKVWLALLEQLNVEYLYMTGEFYIDQKRVLDYHSKQWSAF